MFHEANCLSHWFPKLQSAGLPVPKTKVVHLPDEARGAIYAPFDGKPLGPEADQFLDELQDAAQELVVPCFLRTGHTSGKHSWQKTCFVQNVSKLPTHVLALIEFSECCCFFGLPWNVWAVRELLPTKAVLIADRYQRMPLCREFRFFVEDDVVLCHHPYWPEESAIRGFEDLPKGFYKQYANLCRVTDQELAELYDLARRAGAALGGSWSIDFLDTERGWFLTDVARAEDSWHWPNCVNVNHKKAA